MDIFQVFTLLGGLAFFLYGMNVMSGGLENMVGSKLEYVLGSMTSSKIKSLALGTVITCAVQSSSAVTVMLVGLVNSGIMQLGQSVGVIMGSNIGTTITAWILSITGIESDNFFVTLLKPSSFSPIVALIGVLFIMGSKKGRKKSIGTILIGFSVLMTGMEFMSDAVDKLLTSNEAFKSAFEEIINMFSNPFAGILLGTVVTAIIQSSSASVGILQSIALTGALNFNVAFPIILGQNIGTCVTALISSIGTNKNAKRVTAVHLSFNIIGTAIFLVLFYSLDAIFNFSFADQPISAVGIAIVHSAFNICTTIILFPFSKQLEKLSLFLIREKSTKEELLDERLLLSPSFAITECRNITVQMAKVARDAIVAAISMFDKYDSKKAEEIRELEDKTDLYEDKLGSFLVKISSKTLSDKDSNAATELLHNIGDFERIGDHAVNLLKAAEEIHEKGLKFSDEATQELNVLASAITDILDITIEAFENDDTAMASKVEPLEQVIDELTADLKNRHIVRLKNGQCTIELGFVLSDILTNYSRVSDHCSNIGVCVIQIKNSSMDAHEYLKEVKTTGSGGFTEVFEAYRKQYTLPAQNS